MSVDNPYVQIIASSEEYLSLSPIPKESVQSLVLYYSNKIFFKHKVKDIKRLAGKNLSFLAIKEIDVDNEDVDDDRISMSEIVSNLIVDCSYIQVLILSPIHFNESLKLEALHSLTRLKTLGLSSCAFKYDQYEDSDVKITFQQKSFEQLTKNIRDVEHFSIMKCKHHCDCRGPRDKDLSAISNWKRLKTLSIINVDTLKFFPFLRNVAIECLNFKSLEIADTSSTSIVHHYIPNVMTLLSHSSQLIQLCINMDILCIKNQRFWNAIASAKSLQSLCLNLTAASGVSPKLIANAVEELPLLHLFHLNSPTIYEGLALRLTRIMKRHGVKHPKVELTTLSSPTTNHIDCDSPHLFIA